MLVGFGGPATSRSYFGVQFYIERSVGPSSGPCNNKGSACRVSSSNRPGEGCRLTPQGLSAIGVSTFAT